MGVFHSHSILCSCVLAGDATNSVEEVVMPNTLKHATSREKNDLFVQLVQWIINMMSKEEDGKVLNAHKMIKEEELFKSEKYAEHLWVRMLKDMLCMFAGGVGRGGFPIFTCFPYSF